MKHRGPEQTQPLDSQPFPADHAPGHEHSGDRLPVHGQLIEQLREAIGAGGDPRPALADLKQLAELADGGHLPEDSAVEALGTAHALADRLIHASDLGIRKLTLAAQDVLTHLKWSVYYTDQVEPEAYVFHAPKPPASPAQVHDIPWTGFPVEVWERHDAEAGRSPNLTLNLGPNLTWQAQSHDGRIRDISPQATQRYGLSAADQIGLRNAAPHGLELTDLTPGGVVYRYAYYPKPSERAQRLQQDAAAHARHRVDSA